MITLIHYRPLSNLNKKIPLFHFSTLSRSAIIILSVRIFNLRFLYLHFVHFSFSIHFAIYVILMNTPEVMNRAAANALTIATLALNRRNPHCIETMRT